MARRLQEELDPWWCWKGILTFSSVKASRAMQTLENDPCPRSFTKVYLSPTWVCETPLRRL